MDKRLILCLSGSSLLLLVLGGSFSKILIVHSYMSRLSFILNVCDFLNKSHFYNGWPRVAHFCTIISATNDTKGFHVKIGHRGSPGNKIWRYVSFGTLFESLTWRVTLIYRATVKNLTLGFSPKNFLGVSLHVGKSGKKIGAKSQCSIFHGRPIHAV